MNKLSILGVNIDSLDMLSASEKVKRFLEGNCNSNLIFTANPHSLILSRTDNLFKNALNSANLLIPDGILLVWASKIFYPHHSIPERVAGPDLFIETCRLANQSGCKFFFYGSTQEALHQIKERINKEYPNIRIVGSYAPPFNELSYQENEQIISLINESNPDILWVGMTAPKQEKWIFKNKDRLNAKIIGAIGAAFDFYAGTKKRSPKWFRDHGLEWFPRLLREPKRLWRRSFISAPLFLLFVIKEKFKKSSNY